MLEQMEELREKIRQKFNRAIVTGGAGFIGSHLVGELLDSGIEVMSIDDYSAGKKENIKDYISNKNFTEADCDICDHNELKPYFDGVDVVFHNAASKKLVCLRDPRRDLEVNAKGTFNILELSRDFKVKKIVHASTGSVYGEAKYFPYDETHPVNPVSYYGVSKLAGEKYATTFHHLYNLDVSVLRYFNVYGPRQEYKDGLGGVISIFLKKFINNEPITVFGDGTQQRSFTYVKDIVGANLFAATDSKTKGEVFNCASGLKISISDLIGSLKDILKKNQIAVKYEDWAPGDIKHVEPDVSKIKNFGFNLATSFEDGLKETADWGKQYFK